MPSYGPFGCQSLICWESCSAELRHVSGLYVVFDTFFLNVFFFLKTWLLTVCLNVKCFYPDDLLDLNGHVIDHALN